MEPVAARAEEGEGGRLCREGKMAIACRPTKMLKRTLFLWTWIFAAGAFAQDEGHIRYLKDNSVYRVNPDATYSVVSEVSYRLLTEAALVADGKAAISYSRGLEEVEVLEAYTLKPDGRRIAVGESGVQLQEGQLATGYEISQADQRKLMITFPQLEVGDAAVYRYRLTGKTTIFPDRFFTSHVYSRHIGWDAVEVSINVPAAMVLRTEAVQMDALPVREKDGRRIYRWRARNLPVVHREPSSVDLFPVTPHLVASTFQGWGEFAAAYERLARPKAQVTQAIRQMADEITRSAANPRDQARLLYEWVARNVRYVASWIGAEGWVPHAAELVLSNRYGDCKDHVVLLEALLAAKGIASSSVMINRDKSSYSLPSVAFPDFNHVITYLPAFGLYLDSTTGSTTPFGTLPITEIGKPVIHTSGFDRVRYTPMNDPGEFTSTRISRLAISRNGAMRGELDITATGPATIELRQMRQALGQRKEQEWVRDMLADQILEGEGHIKFDDASNGASMALRLNVNVKDYLAVSKTGTIPLAPLLPGPLSFDSLRAVYTRARRALPYWCPAWRLEDRYEIRLPRDFRLTLPKGKAVEEAGYSYRSRYLLRRGMLLVTRRLSIRRAAMACRPQDYAEAKAAVSRIEHDLRAQVIYRLERR